MLTVISMFSYWLVIIELHLCPCHSHRHYHRHRMCFAHIFNNSMIWKVANTFENSIGQYIHIIQNSNIIYWKREHLCGIYSHVYCKWWLCFFLLILHLLHCVHVIICWWAMDNWCRVQTEYVHAKNPQCRMVNCACKISVQTSQCRMWKI